MESSDTGLKPALREVHRSEVAFRAEVDRVVASFGGERWIDTREYCDLRGWKSTQTARAERMRGGGPPFIRTGKPPYGRILYLLSDVVAHLLSMNKFRSTAEEHVRPESGKDSAVPQPAVINHQGGEEPQSETEAGR